MSKDDDRPNSLLQELERGLRIDKNDLDGEWIRHPDLTYKVNAEFASAISRRDGLKLSISELTADLDKQLRNDAVRAQAKITDTAIGREIDSMPKMVDAKRAYGLACYNADRWQGLKEAYTQRSYALKYLVELYGMGYFASATGSVQRRDATDRKAGEAREATGAARRHRVQDRD